MYFWGRRICEHYESQGISWSAEDSMREDFSNKPAYCVDYEGVLYVARLLHVAHPLKFLLVIFVVVLILEKHKVEFAYFNILCK